MAFALSEVGAMEGSEQRRDVPRLRCSQAPSGGWMWNRLGSKGGELGDGRRRQGWTREGTKESGESEQILKKETQELL